MFQLVNYSIFRENNPDFYANVNPLDLSFIGDAEVVSVVPYREQNGRRIMIYKIGKTNYLLVVIQLSNVHTNGHIAKV